MNDGDWICSDANCGNINFARRFACYRCNKEKPESSTSSSKKLGTEIGKSAAEKSRGLFNADDWQCNKCANVNWARRSTCNVCNAPKFGEVEARTGYGGGYNERGVVEYRRREHSSDDEEFDELGRRKRRPQSRKSESTDKVGVTDGPVHKNVPPTLQREYKLVRARTDRTPDYHMQNTVSGSLSDGSVCDAAPLNKMALRRHQLQSKINDFNQDYRPIRGPTQMNRNPNRKRQSSSGDREHTGSSGYETGPKLMKTEINQLPVSQCPYPVMENSVSSTNGVAPKKNVTTWDNPCAKYTLEDKVKIAAFALVYGNCKIAKDKFEFLTGKHGPDFSTIFALRQQLISTGCLDDSHDSNTGADPCVKINKTRVYSVQINQPKSKVLPNPEEIPLDSDDDDFLNKTNTGQQKPSSHRSLSVETLLIDGGDKSTRSSVRSGRGRNRSRSRSSSRSDYSRSSSSRSRSPSLQSISSASDIAMKEATPQKTKMTNSLLTKTLPSKTKKPDSGSDSMTCCSDETDFLSRRYRKKKVNKRPFPELPKPKILEIPVPPTVVKGYNTAAKVAERSPLSAANTFVKIPNMIPKNREFISNNSVNLYASNLMNMTPKKRGPGAVNTGKAYNSVTQHTPPGAPLNISADNDGYASEYVPSKVASVTRNNYQAFKNNVKKQGYWAKANGSAIVKKVEIISSKVLSKDELKDLLKKSLPAVQPQQDYLSAQGPLKKQCNDLTKDDFTNDDFFENIPKTPCAPVPKSPENIFRTPLPVTPKSRRPIAVTPENTSRIFDAVHSESATKNRSILDIFGNDQSLDISEENENRSTTKRYEAKWDEDDDALYHTDDPVEDPRPSPPSRPPETMVTPVRDSPQAQSLPTSLFCTSNESTPKKSKTKRITIDTVRDRRDQLLGLFGDITAPATRIPDHDMQQSPRRTKIQADHVQRQHHELSSLPKQLDDEIIPLSEGQQKKNSHNSSVSSSPLKQSNIPGLDPSPTRPVDKDTPHESQQQCNVPEPEDDRMDVVVETTVVSQLQQQCNVPEPEDDRMDVLKKTTVVSQLQQQCNVAEPEDDRMDVVKETTVVSQLQQQYHVPEPEDDRMDVVKETTVVSQSETPKQTLQIDLSNLLSGINANALLLALQNLQNCGQNQMPSTEANRENKTTEEVKPVETINLTYDEDWEKESNHEDDIERQLERMDGNTGDTPFLSDMFDPDPVVKPDVTNKLNLNLKKPEISDDSNMPLIDENAPVIGNFKSFALPKPIMLNRLKLNVPKPKKKSKRKKKSKKGSAPHTDDKDEDDEEEESGDDADLAKYDLWGSDDEQGQSSTAGKAEKGKPEKEVPKVGGSSEAPEINGTSSSTDAKDKKKRSRSSSSSSTSSSSSSSSQDSAADPKNKFDDFNLNSERESPPGGGGEGGARRSRSPHAAARRRSRDGRAVADRPDGRGSRDRARDRDRRDRPDRPRSERRDKPHARPDSYYVARGRHR